MTVEYACQRREPNGTWDVVGIGPDERLWAVTQDYLDWSRDLGSSDDLRIVSRPVAEWSPLDPSPQNIEEALQMQPDDDA